MKMRMLSSYSQSEVNTAALNATIVGSIYTQLGADYAAERLGDDRGPQNWDQFNESRANFYEKSRGVMRDSRFLTLFPTDRLDMNTQARQTSGYVQFQVAFLQAFAATLGISYEQLSMDWSRTNYSSARAALNEVWRSTMRLRSILIASFAVPVFTAWLEEALDIGEVEAPAGAPDFHDAPYAYLRSDWIGPGRGYIDPVKEAQAGQLRIDGQVSTLEREAAEQGLDWEMVLEQLARERAEKERLGIGAARTDLSIQPRTDAEDRRANEGV
jgi:lambda family phage portal protein